jgi:hypothetical protein
VSAAPRSARTAAIEIHPSQRRNLDPKLYRWHAKRTHILAKLERAHRVEAAQGSLA